MPPETPPSQSTSETQPEPIKRIIGVTGDKGGTGKSTVSRTIADLAIQKNISTLIFDCDKRNAQLHRYYDKAFQLTANSGSGVARIDLSVKGGADKLINSLDSGSTQLYLIDFPAGGGELFERLEKEVKLFDFLNEIGCKLTAISVISRVKDCINSLRDLLEYCGKRADYVVAKNCFFGEPGKFSRFDNSKTKLLLEELGGVIINFPDLYDTTYDLLDDQNLTFTNALKPESGLLLADRRRIKVFLDEVEAELSKADHLLGLIKGIFKGYYGTFTRQANLTR
ncbi:chromosome partitioning protein ParA [bacterium]|nr:chromosome partitioning protein ParA [bacterium]